MREVQLVIGKWAAEVQNMQSTSFGQASSQIPEPSMCWMISEAATRKEDIQQKQPELRHSAPQFLTNFLILLVSAGAFERLRGR